MASATPSGAPGLGGTGEEWEAFDEEHYDGCSATNAAHHWALGSLRMALAAGHSPDGVTNEYPNHGPLHAACDTIKFCLAQMDGRVTFRVGKTEDDGVACVQVLLGAGASLNELSYNHFTPLHLACNGGYIKIVRVLLSAGANVGYTLNGAGLVTCPQTPLHNAVTFTEGNCEQTVAALIAAGANIEALDHIWAARTGERHCLGRSFSEEGTMNPLRPRIACGRSRYSCAPAPRSHRRHCLMCRGICRWMYMMIHCICSCNLRFGQII